MDWEEACEQCERIIEKCDEMPSRAEDFTESVREKVQGIWGTIEVSEEVTENQQNALDNMEAGLDKWLDR